MKASEVYLKAAEVIDCGREWACCPSISGIVGEGYFPIAGYGSIPEIMRFLDTFNPTGRGHDGRRVLWSESHEDRGPRVLALLLMSHIAADEERK